MGVFHNALNGLSLVSAGKFGQKPLLTNADVADLRSELDAIHGAKAVLRLRLDGTITDANALFLAMSGYRLEELAGRSHSVLLPQGPAHARVDQELWQKLRNGQSQEGGMLRRRKDGRDLWLRASYIPVPDEAGNIDRIMMYGVDITDQRHLTYDFESQILAIREVQAVAQFSVEGTLQDANNILLEMLGFSLEELKGRHHSTLGDPALARNAGHADFWLSLRDGKAITGEYQLLKKHADEALWLHASFVPCKTHDGHVAKIMMFATDITQQKLQNADYQAQIEGINATQGVVQYTLDGYITHANDNFLRQLGFQASELIGQHHRIFVRKELQNAPGYLAQWEQHRRGEGREGVFRHKGKGDRYLWMNANYIVIKDDKGKPAKRHHR